MPWLSSSLAPSFHAFADTAHDVQDLDRLPTAWWTIGPFVGLLLCIALMPLLAEKLWHGNLRKLGFSLLWSAPIVGYFAWLQFARGFPALTHLKHSMIEYVEFMVLLTTLYAIAGGIVVRGTLHATPMMNVGVLALGGVLANVIGTTGASMLLIRPFLRLNRARTNKTHLPVFFIFCVSNLGGLLTPLGDPPLFLGFLKGVDFFWTLRLFPIWATALGIVLAVFAVWDTLAFQRDVPPEELSAHQKDHEPLHLEGWANFVLLGGVVGVVLMQAESIAGAYALPRPWGSVAAMAALTLASMAITPRRLREANEFTWEAIVEVAVLFLGIFITMTPALDLLSANRALLGMEHPWQFFWTAGALSSFLDNAPTYVVFASIAAGSESAIATLPGSSPTILAAISAGAVLMGANTYIGNGPNFMVKAIADGMGCPTPSFFGYMRYSLLILIPTFVVVTLLFFRPF